MGKRDKKKKDPQKKALQRAQKEAKQDKKAAKKLVKEQRKESDRADDGGDAAASGIEVGEDDIDAILASYKKRNNELATPVVRVLGEGEGSDGPGGASSQFPSPPRGNFTLTAIPSGELVMFGGEFYNGAENLVFDSLYRWDPDAKAGDDDDAENGSAGKSGIGDVVNDVLLMDIGDEKGASGAARKNADSGSSKINQQNPGVWKQILSPPPIPPARCSHTAVYYNHAIYVFGGELATAEKYHHYKDIWRFDIKANLWSEVIPRGGHAPPSRSGHRCIVWRHYMIMFGGFYEALRETRWYSDLWVYDFSQNAWTEMEYSKLATIPEARSAFNFCLSPSGDTAFVYGGYSKLKNPAPGSKSEAKIHNDCWALHLKGIASGRTPTWDRVSRRGEYPSIRSGTSSIPYKSRMLVFGGVADDEQEHHKLKSIFYDDLFAFDMDRRRWFKMGLKKSSQGGRRRKRKDDNDAEGQSTHADGTDRGDDDGSDGDDDEMDIASGVEGEATSSGWDLDMLRANMFAFIDGDGNVVYEKIEDDADAGSDSDSREHKKKRSDESEDTNTASVNPTVPRNNDDKSKMDITEAKMQDVEEAGVESSSKGEAMQKLLPQGAVGTSEVMAINSDSGVPEAVARETPLPRIHAAVVVRGSTLYVYGGLLEVGDREVTLDDCWSIDLNKRERWACIWPGSMHKQVWRGVAEDDESYISTGVDDSEGEDDDDDNDWMLSEAISEEEGEDGDAAPNTNEKEKRKKKEKTRDKISRLREEYNLDELERTPQVEESMADFYSRTSRHWEVKAAEAVRAVQATEDGGTAANASAELSAKELRAQGFDLARERYEELKPVLDSLVGLEAHQKEKKLKKKERKDDSGKSSKKSKKKDRK